MWRTGTHDHQRDRSQSISMAPYKDLNDQRRCKLIPLSTIRLLGKMYYFFQLFLTVLSYFVYGFTP
jgi:hypothetical protein